MVFEVCANQNKKRRLLFAQVVCLIMIAGLFWFIHLNFINMYIKENGYYPIFVGFIGIFILIFAFSSYAKKRSRIMVNGNQITIYPLWRRKEQITLSEITSRKVYGDASDSQKMAAVSAAGGFLGSLLKLCCSNKNARPLETIYTYYSGNKKRIAISTREMQNVEQFDKMVVDCLNGKKIEYTEEKIEDVNDTKRIKKLLLLVMLFGIGCVLAVGSMLLFAPQKDVLSGTSWIAKSDGSKWIFYEDKSTYWYQNPNETNDNYYAGTYEVHIDKDVIEQLSKQWGITEWELQQAVAFGNDAKGELIGFSVTNYSFMRNGQEQLSKPTVTGYYGILSNEKNMLSIVNMTTGGIYIFEREQSFF